MLLVLRTIGSININRFLKSQYSKRIFLKKSLNVNVDVDMKCDRRFIKAKVSGFG